MTDKCTNPGKTSKRKRVGAKDIKRLLDAAKDARDYAAKYVGDGENENGVAYEVLDAYAIGLRDALRCILGQKFDGERWR